MNILDFEVETLNGPVLEEVFKKVEDIFYNFYSKFQPNLKDTKFPIDIDTYNGQMIMKDFLEIRVVEELMEMREAIKENHVREHILEEVGDSFNFLINSYVIYGWGHKDLPSMESLYKKWSKESQLNSVESISAGDLSILEVVYKLGLTCNKLKIRPWKQTQYLTDILVFEKRFKELFELYCSMIFTLGFTPEDMWSVFSRKNQCNMFRLKTGY